MRRVPNRRLTRTLEETFGLFSLRPGQAEAMQAVFAGEDVVVVMPTGAGKSLCYQLPALHLAGTTIVVSPLIALMKDQVDHLTRLGIEVALVNSTLTDTERREILEEIEGAEREFVFVTPEQLADPAFLDTLSQNAIDIFVIDEAHCISEWGHDFRPSYLRLRQALESLGHPPVLALTATATPRVLGDVVTQLGLADARIVNTGVFRPNLHFSVEWADDEAHKRERVVSLLEELDGTGLVYVATLRHCEELCDLVREAGFDVERYHGRLRKLERRANQEAFMAGRLKCLVATNAFGMGIDKSDIRFVIHYDIPGSLEAYYQEAGRAGRDGERARCVLLYHPQDRRTQLNLLRGRYPDAEHFEAVCGAFREAGGQPRTRSELGAGPRGRGLRKLLVAIEGLKQHGILEEPVPGQLRPTGDAVAGETIGRLAELYRKRRSDDRQRLDEAVIYAQSARCRWRILLDYFGDPTGPESCGVCDNCVRTRERQAAEARAEATLAG